MDNNTIVDRINEEERREICDKLEWEGGLEYLLRGSNFPWVKDLQFHTLRLAFVKAAKELDDYIHFEEYLMRDESDEG
jgi:hypothetical protein